MTQPVLATNQNGLIARYAKPIAILNISIQIVFPLSLAFTPAMMAHAATNVQVIATEIYVFLPGDTVQSVAEKNGLTVAELKKLNQLRKFSKPFEALTTGDEIDIPLIGNNFTTQSLPHSTSSPNDSLLAQSASQVGNTLQNNPNSEALNDLARSSALSAANAKAGQEISDWLNGKGKVRVKLDADRDFSVKNSQLDLLVPLWESESHMIFSQGSVHRTDDRTQSNLGLGYRYFADSYALGANTFYDHDWSRSHSRLGLGAEYQRNFFKLATNGYLRLSNWKDSPDFDNYEERPANGWDIRAEGYLPSYPGLGAKLAYEQYYGDNVGLFGKDNQQKNPHAITFGGNYSPFPLLKFSVDQRQGKGGQNDTRFGIDLNYTLGTPLSHQLDRNQLIASRSLIANRYDFVDRNNNIVLEYRKKNTLSLKLAQQVSGYTGERKSLEVSVNSSNGLERIDWDAPELLSNGGQIIQEGPGLYSVIVPEFQYGVGAANQYIVNATAYDNSGNASQQASTTVVVTASAVSTTHSEFTPTEIVLANDGQSTEQLTLVLRDNKGQPVIGVANDITMNITQSARTQPDVTVSKFTADPARPGYYLATLTAGMQTGVFILTPEIQNVKTTSATAILGETAILANGAVITLINDAAADGTATNEVQATVTNAFGKPVPDAIVNFSASSNGVTVVTASATTDANGVASTNLTSTQAGSYTITAQVNGQSSNTQVTFVADNNTAEIGSGALTVTANDALANGSAPNTVKAVITDAHGNLVSGAAVTFSAQTGVTVVTASATTDANGVASTNLTSTQAGSYTITALVNGQSSNVQVTFVADNNTAVIGSGALTVTANDAAANGSAPNTVKAVITDAHGNLVSGAAVAFSAQTGVTVVTANSTTDANGVASTNLTSTQAGSFTITALVNGQSSNVQVTFVADNNTAVIGSGALTVTANDAAANGSAPNTVKAVITDAHGNLVSGAAVTFSAQTGVTVVTANAMTDANGVATTNLTSTLAGSYTITALVNGQSSNVQVTFIADSNTAVIGSGALTVTANDAVANGSATNTVQAVVTDAKGNLVSDVTVSFSAPADVGVVTANAITNVNGVATTNLTTTRAGASTITATINGKSQNTSVTFVPGAAVTAQSNLVASPTTIAANGTAASVLMLTLKDANGNMVSGQNVNFATSQTGSSVSNITDNNNGTYTARLVSTRTGSATLAASGSTTVTTTIDSNSFNIDLPVITLTRAYITQPVSNGNAITATTMTTALNKYESIYYSFADGSWSGSVTLPASAEIGAAVKFESNAMQASTISYNSTSVSLTTGMTLNFLYNGSAWVRS
ncbi:Ig-like domain-containing protein [Yersinia rohdei]|uniref:Ig-like domain-containing protein n=1 Tax=Yersinia rohdei TaxID=29485 RepID=UPI001643E656|nr:inverse autotransporter beta domain-containing protein [Yersinia rohdei]